MNDKLRT